MASPHLRRKLKENLGSDAGEELAAVTERLDPLVAELAALRRDMEALKTQISLDLSELRSAVKHELIVQTRWMFAMWATLMIALIART